MKRREPRGSALLGVFSAILVGALVWIYYASELRDRIENKLYDLRTRVAPSLVSTDSVAVVAIDEPTIQALGAAPRPEGTAPPPPEGDGPPRDLDYAAWIKVVKATLATRARAVAVVLPPQVFPYDAPELDELVALSKADPRLVFGTFDQTIKGRGRDNLPKALQGAEGKIFRADITRPFRRDVIRTITVREPNDLPYLSWYLARTKDPAAVEQLIAGSPAGVVKVELNYVGKDKILHLPAEKLVQDADSGEALAGRVVLIGYTAMRPWNFKAREATYVNSPWQTEADDPSRDGYSIVTMLAMTIANLVERSWLTEAPWAVAAVHAALVLVASAGAWLFSVGFATFLFIGGWSLLLILHAMIFAFLQVRVPLADSLLFSSLATVTGAVWRLRLEGRIRAGQEARFNAEKELAATQERFLDRFAVELSRINDAILTVLRSLGEKIASAPAPALLDTYQRALGSGEELAEYLEGIHQFAQLRDRDLTKITQTKVDVGEVIKRVVSQFDTRRQEANLDIRLEVEPGCAALVDRTVLGQIVYNLVSNAVKYSPPGGSVIVAATTTRVSSTTSRVLITVKDSGPGIAPEFHEQIFEKFYRVKDDFVYRTKGHGLGLYLSRYFAQRIGATLSVASTPGQGALFTLTLKAFPHARHT